MKENNELEKICINCNNFFPAEKLPTEWGICALDPEIEPHLDNVIEENYTDCKDLLEKKKFLGDKPACVEFSPVEIMELEGFELDEEEMKDPQKIREKLLSWMVEKQLEETDWSKMPAAPYEAKLRSPDPEEKQDALQTLAFMTRNKNKEAYAALLAYVRSLPPPLTLEDVHCKVEVLEIVQTSLNSRDLIPLLIADLHQIPSNQTTRQWFTAVFRYLETCPFEEVHEPIQGMLADKKFSYRIKQRLREILDTIMYRNQFDRL